MGNVKNWEGSENVGQQHRRGKLEEAIDFLRAPRGPGRGQIGGAFPFQKNDEKVHHPVGREEAVQELLPEGGEDAGTDIAPAAAAEAADGDYVRVDLVPGQRPRVGRGQHPQPGSAEGREAVLSRAARVEPVLPEDGLESAPRAVLLRQGRQADGAADAGPVGESAIRGGRARPRRGRRGHAFR